MNTFVEVTCAQRNGQQHKRLIAVSEIVSVIEEHNHAFIEYAKAKNGRAIFGLEVIESYAEICKKILIGEIRSEAEAPAEEAPAAPIVEKKAEDASAAPAEEKKAEKVPRSGKADKAPAEGEAK